MVSSDERSERFPYLTAEVPLSEGELLSAALWDSDTLGIEESTGEAPDGTVRLRAYFEDEEERDACRARVEALMPGAVVEVGNVHVDDWISLLHGGFEPVAVGPLLVVPASPPPPRVEGATLLRINPGMGFGTGTHTTTRLTLEFLCELVRTGMSVLDVGTGSGILAIAAGLLGASPIVALDIDADALDNAAENLRLNRLGDAVELHLGSIERTADESFDLVLANILTGALLRLFEDGLADRVAPAGSLVISGFPPADADGLADAAAARGLLKSEVRTARDWAAMLLRRPAAD